MIQEIALPIDLILAKNSKNHKERVIQAVSLTNNRHLSYQQLYSSMNLQFLPTLDQICLTLARIFGEIVLANADRETLSSLFDSKKVPGISLSDYFGRFAKYSRCSFESFIIALIFVDRYIENQGNIFIHKTNCHRLFLTGLVLAIKMNDDLHLSNEDLAKIGGVGAAELAVLEWEMFRGLEFETRFEIREFSDYLGLLLF